MGKAMAVIVGRKAAEDAGLGGEATDEENIFASGENHQFGPNTGHDPTDR